MFIAECHGIDVTNNNMWLLWNLAEDMNINKVMATSLIEAAALKYLLAQSV